MTAVLHQLPQLLAVMACLTAFVGGFTWVCVIAADSTNRKDKR
jgi:hypothetical protein